MNPPDNTPELMRKITDKMKRLRDHPHVGRAQYYDLIKTLIVDLTSVFGQPDSIVKHLLQSLEEQYAENNGNVPPFYHLFELDVLLFIKVEELREETILELFQWIFPKLSRPYQYYTLLQLLDKIIHNVILKDKETIILRKLQSLMDPSDKKRIYLITRMAEHILTNWDSENEQKSKFARLLQLPKWSKLEFYICKMYLLTQNLFVVLFQTVLERIFQGFQEVYTAYAAYLLFKDVVSRCHEPYYNIIEEDVVSLLREGTNQTILCSSLITYVIPTMLDRAGQEFIRRSLNFKPIYKVHTIKYYISKNCMPYIDTPLKNNILKTSFNDKTIIMLILELYCSFPNTEVCIKENHLRLFMNCLQEHYDESDPFLYNCIHSFLCELAKSIAKYSESAAYLHLFFKLKDLVCALLEQIENLEEVPESNVIDVHTKATFLMSHCYISLREKYERPSAFMHCAEQDPLDIMHEEYVVNSWSIFKKYIRNGCENDSMYMMMEPNNFTYDAAFASDVHDYLMLAIAKPYPNQLNHIDMYIKLLLKMYKDEQKVLELDNLTSDVQAMLLTQYEYVNKSNFDLNDFANPAYANSKILNIIAMEHKEWKLLFAFDASIHVIIKALALVDMFPENEIKQFLEQIFITHLQTMQTCTKKLHHKKKYILEFLHIWEQVVCKTKFPEVTTIAYDAIFQCRSKPFYKEIVNYFIRKLYIYIEEIEGTALKKYTSNKEILLLTFKVLEYNRKELKVHFERMLNVSQGHQELHLATLEAVCSDAELKAFTAPYLIQIFKITIAAMTHHDFNSRDAAIRLINALADRFMGVKSELDERPLSALQVFECYPELASICFQILNRESNESKSGVLAFIGDSPYNSTMFGESIKAPTSEIGKLMDTDGINVTATIACAMTIKSEDLYHVICEVIKEVQDGVLTFCMLLFIECLLKRLINSGMKERHIQEAFVEFGNLLDAPHIKESGATEHLNYPNYKISKLSLSHQTVSIERIDVTRIV